MYVISKDSPNLHTHTAYIESNVNVSLYPNILKVQTNSWWLNEKNSNRMFHHHVYEYAPAYRIFLLVFSCPLPSVFIYTWGKRKCVTFTTTNKHTTLFKNSNTQGHAWNRIHSCMFMYGWTLQTSPSEKKNLPSADIVLLISFIFLMYNFETLDCQFQ